MRTLERRRKGRREISPVGRNDGRGEQKKQNHRCGRSRNTLQDAEKMTIGEREKRGQTEVRPHIETA